jgi:hypothetical protein
VRELERAQKQVTKMISESADSREGRMLAKMLSPVPVMKVWAVDVVARVLGSWT